MEDTNKRNMRKLLGQNNYEKIWSEINTQRDEKRDTANIQTEINMRKLSNLNKYETRYRVKLILKEMRKRN